MRIFNGVDNDMVTEYAEGNLPVHCSFCGGQCWQTDDYPYACRCSQCSAYFHRQITTCDDLEYDGYDPYSCSKTHGIHALRLFEIADGRLIEVCKGCATWLFEEGFIEELEVIDNEYSDPVSCAFASVT